MHSSSHKAIFYWKQCKHLFLLLLSRLLSPFHFGDFLFVNLSAQHKYNKKKKKKSDLHIKLGIPNLGSTPIKYCRIVIRLGHKTHIIRPCAKREATTQTQNNLSSQQNTSSVDSPPINNNLKQIPQTHQTLHLSLDLSSRTNQSFIVIMNHIHSLSDHRAFHALQAYTRTRRPFTGTQSGSE
jgi:hypothetical protein